MTASSSFSCTASAATCCDSSSTMSAPLAATPTTRTPSPPSTASTYCATRSPSTGDRDCLTGLSRRDRRQCRQPHRYVDRDAAAQCARLQRQGADREPGAHDAARLSRRGHGLDKALDTRFTCRGYLSGQLNNVQDQDAAWTLFNANLEELLGDLRNQPLNNFQWTVARFGRIRFQASGNQVYPIADYYVEGPLGPENSVPPPPALASRLICTARGSAAGRPALSTTASSTARCRSRRRPSRRRRRNSVSISSSMTVSTSCAPSSTRSTAVLPRPRLRVSAAPQTLTTQGGDKYKLRPVKVTMKVP